VRRPSSSRPNETVGIGNAANAVMHRGHEPEQRDAFLLAMTNDAADASVVATVLRQDHEETGCNMAQGVHDAQECEA